jgi:alpha-glucosidase (family GH31 glycosyl hydrolase)
MILSNGLAGAIFGGRDLPYYVDDINERFVIISYQLGVFMPFMRAHRSID